MEFGAFILVTALISIVIVALAVLLDIDDFRTFTIGEYILAFLTCWVPFFNLVWIFFGGGMVILELFSRILFERKWFKDIMGKRPFMD